METLGHTGVYECPCAHMHIHWPSGLLQQPARYVIRLANQAEAEDCLPFISRCVFVRIHFFSAAPLSLSIFL